MSEEKVESIPSEVRNRIVQQAYEEYNDCGTVEIDRDTAKISQETEQDIFEDGGAYVQAWVWVGIEADEEDE
tara:strand:- start:300 stop:515 length:216 start_codon:yes stop_codon:yes gene_type:complete